MSQKHDPQTIAVRYQALCQALPDTILHLTEKGILIDFKQGDSLPLFSKTTPSSGVPIEKILSSDLADQYHYYIKKTLDLQKLQTCEYQQENNQIIFNVEARFIACDKNEVFVLLRNISKQKTAEQQLMQLVVQLEESFDNMLSIFNLLSLGTIMIDEHKQLTFINAAALKLLALQKGDYTGRPWTAALPFSAIEKNKIKDNMFISPKKRRKTLLELPITPEHIWLEIEVKDHPKNPLKKILFLTDVSEIHRLQKKVVAKDIFEGIVGQSLSMQRIFQQISELAAVDMPVLIQGETGTGKELVAHALHKLSPRKDKPFIAVNCAGLATDSMLSSQLFGHKKGSFTGAIADHKGYLEVANGGTLFLDEIGDMPLSVQTHLLRFLQEKEITRIGESQPIQLNVRIVAASQNDLHQEVTKGRIRKDLLYRIRVATIDLPALRERREDVPLLAKWFVQKKSKEQGKVISNVAGDTLQALITYAWPGNVREMEGLIEMAVLKCQGPILEWQDLPQSLLKEELVLESKAESVIERRLTPKQRIVRALEDCEGNKSEAAKLLGMSRATFYRKLDKFKIDASEWADF